jgi:hypothetical protein
MTGARLNGIVRGMMEQTFQLAIDPLVEKAVEASTDLRAKIQQPTAEASQRAELERADLQGTFVKCYEVLNATSVTMNYF